MYALILAGGSGTRLWPYSRNSRPKQFLSIDGQESMLQETVNRTRTVISLERVLVATSAAYVDLVAEQLPDLPRENILAEPAGRGTAPCIGLAALHLRRRDPDAVMAVLSADHRIVHADMLCKALTFGEQLARQDYLVTLGIQPTAPSSGYGYIQYGESVRHADDLTAYNIVSFDEKPDRSRAEAYLARGSYVWNAGMFVWRADRIVHELAQHRPAVAHSLAVIDVAIGTPHEQAVLAAVWPEIETIAIDVAVMEQTTRAVVIPAGLGWSDIGDWAALAETLPRDQHGNAVIGTHIGVHTANSLIYGNGRVVATIGLEDVLIIDTHDVLLVCPRDRAQDVKTLVGQMRERHHELL